MFVGGGGGPPCAGAEDEKKSRLRTNRTLRGRFICGLRLESRETGEPILTPPVALAQGEMKRAREQMLPSPPSFASLEPARRVGVRRRGYRLRVGSPRRFRARPQA